MTENIDVEEAKKNIKAAVDCAEFDVTEWYLQQAYTALGGKKEELFHEADDSR